MMSAGSHIADTIRTLLIGGTVAFLGYLGYTLLQARINNPPPQVVTMDDEEVEELRTELAAARHDVARLKRQVEQLSKDHDRDLSSDTIRALGFSDKTKIEYGTVVVRFKNGENNAGAQVKFRNTYKKPPVVLISHDGPRGTYTDVAAVELSKKRCWITVNKADKRLDEYKAVIAYLAIGEAD